MGNEAALVIEDVGPIGRTELLVGQHLTVLVGPQAVGKSLILQLFKVFHDGPRMVRELRQQGFSVDTGERIIDQFLGEGMHSAMGPSSRVTFAGKELQMEALIERRGVGRSVESCFYIPAHRALALAEGWPVPFAGFRQAPPYVVRRYSQDVLDLLQKQLVRGVVFPRPRKLPLEYQESLSQAIFHGGQLIVDTQGPRKQLVLSYGEAKVSSLAWTAGQRELVPLLLGLYRLIPSGQKTKRPGVDWVVLEEPEMGLHPKAVRAVMALVLELIHRGYRILLSTHSPSVLDLIWGLKRLSETTGKGWLGGVARLLDIEVPEKFPPMFQSALELDAKVYAIDFAGDRTRSWDISSLDPSSEDEVISGWGGLSGISSEIGSVVCEAVNRAGTGE